MNINSGFNRTAASTSPKLRKAKSELSSLFDAVP